MFIFSVYIEDCVLKTFWLLFVQEKVRMWEMYEPYMITRCGVCELSPNGKLIGVGLVLKLYIPMLLSRW